MFLKASTLLSTIGVLSTAGILTAALAGCPSEPETPVTPFPDGGLEPMPAPTPTPTTTATPVPTSTACDANVSFALDQALTARAKLELDYHMKPESVYVCQQVTEGQSASASVMIMPNKCYSFLGQGYPNVTEVDLLLKIDAMGGALPPGLPAINPILAQDGDTGMNAAIGRKSACYKLALPIPIPVPARIEVKARYGSGPVAVKVYSR